MFVFYHFGSLHSQYLSTKFSYFDEESIMTLEHIVLKADKISTNDRHGIISKNLFCIQHISPTNMCDHGI